MKEIVSTVTSKGQVTLPAEVRKHLGVKLNDKIAFVIEQDGSVRVGPPRYTGVASVRGAAGSLDRPLDWSQMREIAHEDRLDAKYSRGQ